MTITIKRPPKPGVGGRSGTAMRAVFCLAIFLPLIIIASVWWPYRHFYRLTPRVERSTIEVLRSNPDTQRLSQIASRESMLSRIEDADRDPVGIAQAMLQGNSSIWASGHAPPRPGDIDRLPPSDWLGYVSLAPIRVYLRAYGTTAQPRYLQAARDYLLDFIAQEKAAWKPDHLLWNDHALAQRAQMLIEFWEAYRQSPIYAEADAATILGFVAKTGAMLADPALYTYRTNHGVMQNLALLQLRLAFPDMPFFRDFGDLAFARLGTQLPHYLNAEGVILEHSAGYQAFGVAQLEAIWADLTALGYTIPADWQNRFDKAQAANRAMHFCDGRLPRWGDTNARPQWGLPVIAGRLSTPIAGETIAAQLYPAAGLAIWASGQASGQRPAAQDDYSECPDNYALFTWSYYPPLGHKHADDLAFFLHAASQDWWTAIGYLSSAPPGAAIASAWDEANAPHWAGEQEETARRDQLLGVAVAGDRLAIDASRTSAEGAGFHRQIIQLDADSWIIADNPTKPTGKPSRTVWIMDPAVSPTRVGENRYRLQGRNTQKSLDVGILGGVSTHLARGQLSPFLGWVAEGVGAVPTPALIVDQPAEWHWTINISQLSDRVATAPSNISADWQDAEHWRLSIDGLVRKTISRDAARITINTDKGTEILTLAPAPDVGASVAEVFRAFEHDVRQYGAPVRELWDYRVRMSFRLAGLAVVGWLILAIASRSRIAGAAVAGVTILCWCSIGGWLWFVYF